MIKQLVSLTTVAFAAIVTLTLTAIVLTHADPGGNPPPKSDNDKVRLCHANTNHKENQGNGDGAQGNPYNFLELPKNAVNGDGENDHTQHYGDVFVPNTDMKTWGDIIEPYEGFAGLNWTPLGQALLENDCNYTVASVEYEPADATCQAGEKLYYKLTNATLKNSSTTEDTLTGPLSTTLTFTANPGSLFAGDLTSIDKIVNLSSVQTEGCGGGTTPQVATASIDINKNVTCSVGETLTRGAISYATWSGDESGTTGPTSYTVTATAVNGAHFAAMTNTANEYVSEDLTTKTFTGTLAGPLTEGCDNEEEPTVAAASITLAQASCEAAATLTYGDIENATWDENSTVSGATGPATYTVIAIADEGASFPAGEGVSEDGTTMTFTGTLDPIVTEDCVLGETTDDTTPTVLPETNSATPIATMTLLTGVTGLLVIVTQVLRGLLARKV